MRGLFSLDLLFSSLLLILTVVLLFSSFILLLDSLNSQVSFASSERKAMLFADRLLYSCTPEIGFAHCDGTFIYANELSADALDAFREIPPEDIGRLLDPGSENRVAIGIHGIDGKPLLIAGDPKGKTGMICVKRLGILAGEISVLEVCVS